MKAEVALPAVALPGWVPNTTLVGAPGTTANWLELLKNRGQIAIRNHERVIAGDIAIHTAKGGDAIGCLGGQRAA